jgi:hypothetical protein
MCLLFSPSSIVPIVFIVFIVVELIRLIHVPSLFFSSIILIVVHLIRPIHVSPRFSFYLDTINHVCYRPP